MIQDLELRRTARTVDLLDEVLERPQRLALTADPHRPRLDEDEETSMVESLPLHLMSEHRIWDALTLDEAQATQLHRRFHEDTVCDHRGDDLRFRPRIALSGMQRWSAQRELAERLITAAGDRSAAVMVVAGAPTLGLRA